MSSLKAQGGRSPALGGILFHGSGCIARARPASKAARIWAGSNASTSLPIFTPSGIETMGSFALLYADQTERDHAALKAAVRAGKIKVHIEG